MTTRTRSATAPAYYLGRPAFLWLASQEPRPAIRKPPRAPSANGALFTFEAPVGRRSAAFPT